MSSAQQGVWHAFRRDPESTVYNVFLPARIRSSLDIEALRRSVEFLAERHESLRTLFSDTDGQLRQIVHSNVPPEFRVESSQGCDDDELRGRVLAETQRSFDLTNGPLLRLVVLVAGPDDHIVVATTHHIITD
ncbi:MAG: condensation domain-containing protein, partial [Planctomycetota bacterium]